MNLPPTVPSLGGIVSYGLWMRRQGYRETTIHFSVKSLIWVAERTKLLKPETVKACLALAKTSESRKRKLVEDLARFQQDGKRKTRTRYIRAHTKKMRASQIVCEFGLRSTLNPILTAAWN